MTHTRTLRFTAPLAIACALAFTACGSDNSTASSNPGGAPNPAPAAADPESPASDTPDPGSEATLPVIIPSIPGVDGDCTEIANTFYGALTGLSMQGTPGQPDLETALASIADRLPAELSDDMLIVADAVGQLAEVIMQQSGDDPAMGSPDVIAAMASLDTPAVSAAIENVSNYFDAACVVD